MGLEYKCIPFLPCPAFFSLPYADDSKSAVSPCNSFSSKRLSVPLEEFRVPLEENNLVCNLFHQNKLFLARACVNIQYRVIKETVVGN